MTQKITFMFSSGKYGWSESYYCNQTDLASAFVAAQPLANTRSRLLSLPSRMDFLRISDAANIRVANLVAVGAGTQNPLTTSTWVSASDQPYNAALINVLGNQLGTGRKVYIRGNPDNLFDAVDPTNADAQQWNALFESYRSVLSGAGAFQIKVRTNKSLNELKSATAWTNLAAPSPFSAVTLESNFSVPPVVGNYLIFYGSGLNPRPGAMRILDITPGSSPIYIVNYNVPNTFTGPQNAKLAVFGANFTGISDCQFERFTRRATGRPFGLSRGRRRAVHP